MTKEEKFAKKVFFGNALTDAEYIMIVPRVF
jgi:hypothetical protein